MTTGSYSDAQRAAVSWDQFREMFSTRYVPQVERERKVGSGLPGTEAGFRFGDGDHQDVN